MILQGVDQLRVISPAEMERLLRIANIGFIAFYLKSPCQMRTQWTPEDVSALNDLGLLSLPIYVGSQTPFYECATDLSTDTAGEHARDAAAKMEAFGYMPWREIPCVLDVEAETYTHNPTATADYAAAWMAELDRCGYLPTLYGDKWTIAEVKRQVNHDAQYWLARWTRQSIDPSITTRGEFTAAGLEVPAGRRLLQYASVNNYVPMGRGYDFNVCDAELAPAF